VLSEAVGGSWSWVLHDPGKVLGDVALTLADGGDALRHTMVIDRQPVLFATVASPASAPALGGIGVASRPGSRPSPATPGTGWDRCRMATGIPPITSYAGYWVG